MSIRISIITINLNNNKGLTDTISSIREQSYTGFEHIVIDGGSTDGSKETVARYADSDNRLAYWVSEKDRGIYSAMNKGILQAKGAYLLFLNSGDFLEPDILDKVEKELDGTDVIYGNLYFLSKDDRVLVKYPPQITASLLISPDFALPHPASLIRKELFQENLYNEKYKIISDWEFFIKTILFKNCTTRHIDLEISNFSDGGISSTNNLLGSQERIDVLNLLFAPKIHNDLKRLSQLEQSPLFEVIALTSESRKFQKRIKKIILFLFKINQSLKFHKKRER